MVGKRETVRWKTSEKNKRGGGFGKQFLGKLGNNQHPDKRLGESILFLGKKIVEFGFTVGK